MKSVVHEDQKSILTRCYEYESHQVRPPTGMPEIRTDDTGQQNLCTCDLHESAHRGGDSEVMHDQSGYSCTLRGQAVGALGPTSRQRRPFWKGNVCRLLHGLPPQARLVESSLWSVVLELVSHEGDINPNCAGLPSLSPKRCDRSKMATLTHGS